jgi:photosystem II stability/assembly factor-like uncharacterized protein
MRSRPFFLVSAGLAGVVATCLLAAGQPRAQSGGATPHPLRRAVPRELRWQRLGGPPGGLGYDIRHSFDDHDVWYVTDAWAGIHTSTDHGRTWSASTTGITTRKAYGAGDVIPVFSATVDPHDSTIIWIGTQDSGDVYRSDDGGLTWEKRVEGIDQALKSALSFRGFTVDPRTSSTVYAMGEIASQGWRPDGMVHFGLEFDMTMGIVYKTIDAGAHWTEIWRGDNLARYCWIDPTNPETLYVSTGIFDREAANTDPDQDEPGGVGILKSIDGGQTWQILGKTNGLADLYVGSLYMHPTDPQVLLAAASQDAWSGRGETFTGGMFVTRDGGDHWERVLTDELFSGAEICASDPNVWYAASPRAVHRSDDNGVTWQRFSRADGHWGPEGIIAGFPIDLQCDPDDPRTVFVNNYLGGNYVSTDGGETWETASSGYTGASVRQVAVTRSNAARVYAGSRTGPFVSADGGRTWAGLAYPPADIPGAAVNEIGTLAVDPTDPDHVLAYAADIGGVIHSENGGLAWAKASGIDTVPSNLTFAPSDPSVVYTGHVTGSCQKMLVFGVAETCDETGADFYVSADGGDTWSTGADMPLNQAITSVAVDPRDPRVLLAGTISDGVLISRNGGATFTTAGSGLPDDVAVRSVAIDPNRPNSVYAGLSGGLYRSLDFGLTWTQSAAGLNPEGRFNALVVDPVRPGVVYAGDWLSGVYVSRDAGDTWSPLMAGLVHKSITSLSISIDGNHLYAAIDGDGVYRLDLDHRPPKP